MRVLIYFYILHIAQMLLCVKCFIVCVFQTVPPTPPTDLNTDLIECTSSPTASRQSHMTLRPCTQQSHDGVSTVSSLAVTQRLRKKCVKTLMAAKLARQKLDRPVRLNSQTSEAQYDTDLESDDDGEILLLNEAVCFTRHLGFSLDK